MVSRLGICAALALALCASVSGSAPFVDGNSPEQARRFMYCDSIIVRGNSYGATGYDREKSIYLIGGTAGQARGQVDSLVIAWHNGGAVPNFRRIQGIRIFAEAVPPGHQVLIVTVFHPDGTSANNYVAFSLETQLQIPLEADSIHFAVNETGFSQAYDMCVCVW